LPKTSDGDHFVFRKSGKAWPERGLGVNGRTRGSEKTDRMHVHGIFQLRFSVLRELTLPFGIYFLKLNNYVASFLFFLFSPSGPTVFTFSQLTVHTVQSTHTHTHTHGPHVLLRRCLLDWAAERLDASFPLVPSK